MVPQRVAAMQRALLRRAIPRCRSLCAKPDPPKSPPPPSALTIAASGLTSFAGIGAISALHFGIAPHDLTMVLGSMGASAVLLYGAPAAPFSQPRNLFLGHGIACVVGVTAHELISVPMDTPILAAPLAVSGSIVLMHLTRSLHPPAGGTVLIAVLARRSSTRWDTRSSCPRCSTPRCSLASPSRTTPSEYAIRRDNLF